MPVYTLLLVSTARQGRMRSRITLVDPIPSFFFRVREREAGERGKTLTALRGSEKETLSTRKARIKGPGA